MLIKQPNRPFSLGFQQSNLILTQLFLYDKGLINNIWPSMVKSSDDKFYVFLDFFLYLCPCVWLTIARHQTNNDLIFIINKDSLDVKFFLWNLVHDQTWKWAETYQWSTFYQNLSKVILTMIVFWQIFLMAWQSDKLFTHTWKSVKIL